MPRRVDPEERRSELLAAVWRVIARYGLQNTTIRRIAIETGWSTGTLAHYFADKEEILISALRYSNEVIGLRQEEELVGLQGLEALRALIHAHLPLDDQRELETHLAINYWADKIRKGSTDTSSWLTGPALIELLTRFVAEGQELGEITRDEPAEDIAERIHSLIDGLSIHALLEPQTLTRSRLVALFEAELRLISAK